MSILAFRLNTSGFHSGFLLSEVPNPTTSELGTWLFCLVCVLTLVLMIKSAFVRKPSIEAEFIAKAEFHDAIKNLSEKMDDGVRDLNANGSRRQREVFEELRQINAKTNQHIEAIANLKESSARHEDAIARFHGRIPL